MQRIITQSIRSFPPRLIAHPQGTQVFRPSCLPQTQRTVPLNRREFANSAALYKKKDKTKKASASASSSEPVETSSAPSEDPFDLSHLHNGISTAIVRLKDDLSKLRAGGRFNTAILETLRVQLSKDSKDSVRLGDLAQVVPKGGRMVTLLVAEEDHLKPLTSAIVSSNLSLTPQPDPHNSLQLNISIPPPTKESRDKNIQAAKQAFEKAAGIDMQKKKLARPDDVRKAHDQMEKVTDQGQKEVKDAFELAKKTLEQA
ncbi:Ribosome recycling factor [Penicillium italicum]|uniref:Ribosome recycling factor n=1 Tax=Penicillium italicum TaxID=40296 RepID=A0A0A2KD67_PENIT|nr:Ribosome recycling factor [Penicillium italicum]